MARSGRNLISVFLPSHVRGREVAQDPIRLKNLLAEVDNRLETLGWKPRDRSDRLARARGLIDDREFWEHQSRGLALYVDEDGQTIPIGLTQAVDPTWTIMEVFEVRHLVPDLGAQDHAVLVLTQDVVRLYLLGRHGMTIQEADLPGSFDDVNWFVHREKQRQQHPGRVGSVDTRHGHDMSGGREEDLSRFVRAVAAALPATASATPLVVLGDDDLVGRFVSEFSGECVSPAHSGVTEPDSVQEIRDLARSGIAEIEEARREVLNRELSEHIGAGRALTSIEAALPAAVSGRVEQVALVRDAAPIWGRFDEFSFDVLLSDSQRPGDVDLLDRLVVESRKTGADLHSLSSPIDGAPFVAVLRF